MENMFLENKKLSALGIFPKGMKKRDLKKRRAEYVAWVELVRQSGEKSHDGNDGSGNAQPKRKLVQFMPHELITATTLADVHLSERCNFVPIVERFNEFVFVQIVEDPSTFPWHVFRNFMEVCSWQTILKSAKCDVNKIEFKKVSPVKAQQQIIFQTIFHILNFKLSNVKSAAKVAKKIKK